MAFFHEITPELDQEIKAAVKKLEEPVRDLNEGLQRFGALVDSGFVKFPLAPLRTMPSDYNDAYMRWLREGAIDDFVKKMEKTYEHFDAEAYDDATMEADESGTAPPNPQQFVSEKKRTVILGSFGSVWIDLPLSGLSPKVSKWTRAAFQYHDDQEKPFWTVHFDPTSDEEPFEARASADFVKLMTTNNVDVRINVQ